MLHPFLLELLRRMLSWGLIQRHFRGTTSQAAGRNLGDGASKVTQVFSVLC